MFARLSTTFTALVFASSALFAQDGPTEAKPKPKPVPGKVETKNKAGDPKGKPKVIKTSAKRLKPKEPERVLRPQDVAAELSKLKTKADIKAEIEIRTSSGRPIRFKGVIKSGKLIERLVDRRFVPMADLKQPKCGVRLWWAANSDGFIFFRYTSIKTLILRGEFTEKDRKELMKRLAAKKKEQEKKATEDRVIESTFDIDKLSEAARRAYLLKRFPYDKGWNHQKYRTLTRQRYLENKEVGEEDQMFLKYFPTVLAPARFEALRNKDNTLKIRPGSDKDSGSDEDE